MRNVIKHWLTESDNQTFDLFRALALLAIFAGIGLAVHSALTKEAAFSLQDYGIGMGALFGGMGVIFGVKKESGG